MRNLYLIVVILMIAASCGSKGSSNERIAVAGQNNQEVKNDLIQLGEMINLSGVELDKTEKAYWSINKISSNEGKIPGPNDYYLVATFKLKKADTNNFKVINRMQQSMEKNSKYYQDWLPESVVDYLFTKSTDKVEIPVYDIKTFAKSPYLQGFFCFNIDKREIYLFTNTQ